MPDITFAEYLVAWRRRLDLTQEQAAERLSANQFGWAGPDRRTIQRWEAGRPCTYPALVLRACRDVEGERT